MNGFRKHKMWKNRMKILWQLDVLLRGRKTMCIKLFAQIMQASKTNLRQTLLVDNKNRGFENVHFTAYFLSAMLLLCRY